MEESTTEEVTIVKQETESPLVTLIKSIAQTVTPIVTDMVNGMMGGMGPICSDICASCGGALEGGYSELNVFRGATSFDRYYLCKVCTDAILSRKTTSDEQ